MIEVEKIMSRMTNSITEEIDCDILEELECIGRNWTSVYLSELDPHTFRDAKTWCEETFLSKFKAFSSGKFYFAEPESATWFTVKWL